MIYIYKYKLPEKHSDHISGGRLTYHTVGVVASLAGGPLIASEIGSVGGPVGALAGAGIGFVFLAGEVIYDALASFGSQLGSALNSAEYSLKSGTWRPGR